jgi:hypothetical protein
LLLLIEPILKIPNLFSLGLGLEMGGADSAFLYRAPVLTMLDGQKSFRVQSERIVIEASI